MFKKLVIVGALALSAVSSQAQVVLLSEGFDSVASLAGAGWVLTNQSVPVGSTGWFQGNTGVFSSQAGAPEAYVAANFNNSTAGGTISNWLITPTFSTEFAVTVSFWARADIQAPFADTFAFGFSNGSSNTSDFGLSLSTTAVGDWTQYSAIFLPQGAGSIGRFAVSYAGPEASANFFGIDTLTVTSAVPEPSAWLMMGVGLLGVAAARRRIGAKA